MQSFLLIVACDLVISSASCIYRADAQLQDNFRLEISDEEAEYFMLDMIEQSVTAFFPVMTEIIHAIAVSMRR